MSDLIAINQENPKSLRKITFRPSEKQRLWTNAAIEMNSQSPTAIQKASGISRESWYGWLEDKDFLQWWDEQWEKVQFFQRRKLIEIGFLRSSQSHDYWRDMMEFYNFRKPEQDQTPVNQVNFFSGLKDKYNKSDVIEGKENEPRQTPEQLA